MTLKSALFASMCFASVCVAQTPDAIKQPANVATHYYRLTVTVGAHGAEPAQDFVLNVPVTAGKPGMAELNISTGAMGEPNSLQQAVEASDVEETPTGLKARIQYVSERARPLAPGQSEPHVNHVRFEQQVDVPLGQSTRISLEGKLVPLGEAALPSAPPLPAPPQISLTAVKL